MSSFARRLAAMVLVLGMMGGGVRAGTSDGLSVDDLGFSETQVQADSATQAILHRRSKQLKRHQLLGLATMVPMTMTLFTGEKAKEGSAHDRSLHLGLGMTAGAMYFTTAGLALTAPEVGEERARGATKWHKALAFVHVPCMIAAPILGYQAYKQHDRGEEVHGMAKHHQAVAGVGYAAFMAAGVLMVFNF